VPSEQDFLRLLRWQRRMIALFVGTWAYLLLVVVAYEVFDASPQAVRWALAPALGLVAAGGWLQLSARCPGCGRRIGLQSRMVVPDRCRACGIALRASPTPTETRRAE